MDKRSTVTEEADIMKEKSDKDDGKKIMSEDSHIKGTIIGCEYSRQRSEKVKMICSEDHVIQKNKKSKQFNKSIFYCCSECDTTDDLQEAKPESEDIKTQVHKFDIRNWNSELRENNIFMDQQNLERTKSKLEKDLKDREAEQNRRENAVEQEQKEMFTREILLENYEQELKTKDNLLQISIKMNELKVKDFQSLIDTGFMSRRIYYDETENNSSYSRGRSTDNSVVTTSPFSEEVVTDYLTKVKKTDQESEDERQIRSQDSFIKNTMFDSEYSRKHFEKSKKAYYEEPDIQKNKSPTQFDKSSLYSCNEYITTEEFQEDVSESKGQESNVEEWHISEWNSELRENKIFMDEQNLEKNLSKLEKDFKVRELEQNRREKAVMQEEKDIVTKKKVLENYEQDLIAKDKLLQISVKKNDIRIEDFQTFIDCEKMSGKIFYTEAEKESFDCKDSGATTALESQ